VFGAAYNSDFEVVHRFVESIEDLKVFRNSKYVQSNLGDAFKQAKGLLLQDRWVCFSGTPCQVEGLKCFLRRDYEKLITVDVVCRAVPSPKIFNKYIEFQSKQLKTPFSNIFFRDKLYGYKYSNFSIYSERLRLVYNNGVDSDVYLRSFFSNINVRPSCYNCSFKKRYRICDFTLWDCFTVDTFDRKMDDDKGTTRVLTHTAKANQILEQISNKINIKEIDVELAIAGVKEMVESVPYNPRRDEFFSDLSKLTPQQVFQKYFPNNLRARLEKLARFISYKLGIYQQMKKAMKLIYKNKANQKR